MVGRKRSIVVDTLGLLLLVMVTAASVSDNEAGKQLLTHLAVDHPHRHQGLGRHRLQEPGHRIRRRPRHRRGRRPQEHPGQRLLGDPAALGGRDGSSTLHL
nr:transposase [Streptomyces sp. YIM 121038]